MSRVALEIMRTIGNPYEGVGNVCKISISIGNIIGILEIQIALQISRTFLYPFKSLKYLESLWIIADPLRSNETIKNPYNPETYL